MSEPGIKPVIRDKQAVCSTSHPLVTATMLDVLRSGGNAFDAAVAGCLLQPVVEPHLTTHGGSLTVLIYEASTGKTHHLNGSGTLVPDLPPFRPLPPGVGGFVIPGLPPPSACIPGYMPALGELHARFGTQSWASLCAPAIQTAEEGHVVSSFEYALLQYFLSSYTYFPSGRALFMADGFLPHAGTRFKNPALAQTLRRCADQGAAEFTEGEWAQHFIAEANRLGWRITPQHMTAVPPRWGEPMHTAYGDQVIVQYAPPEVVGTISAFVLGVLKELGAHKGGHYSENPEALYYMAHVLRRAEFETGMLNDPHIFATPHEVLMSQAYHAATARILKHSRPRIDLTPHVLAVNGKMALASAGLPLDGSAPVGSCEISVVDSAGNWVQLINTVQSGGIPGVVVDGVHFWGSHAYSTMSQGIAGWQAEASRIRLITGSTLILKDGKPWIGLGTPGYPNVTVPQLLWSILACGLSPEIAAELPRMWTLRDDYTLDIEARLSPPVIADLMKLGITVNPLLPYDWHIGSFQMSWRDAETGLLNSYADSRRTGLAGGI